MTITRRALFSMLFAAPLARVFRRSRPPVIADELAFVDIGTAFGTIDQLLDVRVDGVPVRYRLMGDNRVAVMLPKGRWYGGCQSANRLYLSSITTLS